MAGYDESGSSRRATYGGGDYVEYIRQLIAGAKVRIWLKVPWIGRPARAPGRLINELGSAIERGLDVRVLLRPEASNTAAIQELSATEIPHQMVRYLHEKELVVDDRLIVFSANWTDKELGRNENHAYEITAHVDIAAAVQAFKGRWSSDATGSSEGREEWTVASAVVPEALRDLLGRERLNPLQSRAAPVVFGSENNLLVTAPTGSGKTLIGEAAALREIRLRDKKAAYITPSRALTREMKESFDRWERAGIKIAILSGDVDVDLSVVARADLWVATTESFESAFRRSSLATAVADLGCVVVDEIHMAGDPNRGPLLEALLARLRLLRERTRLVGLSATVANDTEIAEWLGADLIASTWRPVSLDLQVLGYEPGDTWPETEDAKDAVSDPIVSELVDDGGSVIVFCGSKPKARRAAGQWAHLDSNSFDDDQHFAEALLREGAALHYRGLRNLREVERRFRDRSISVLFATTGLAQGVNLPARGVIIRDTMLGTTDLTVADSLQMAGRAGRLGQEDRGFAYQLAPTGDVPGWRSSILGGHAVVSQLASELADHILAEVLLGRITSAQSLEDWFDGTLAAFQAGASAAQRSHLEQALELLLASGFVSLGDDQDTLSCTDLGATTSRFMIGVHSAAEVLAELPGHDPGDSLDAERRLLSVMASRVNTFSSAYGTPKAVEETIGVLPAELVQSLGAEPRSGSIKALAAARAALIEPFALSARQDVHGFKPTELSDVADDLARHLGWLGALGQAADLDWVPAVASDLAARLRWRDVNPPRGSGRIVRVLEAEIPGDEQARRLPGRLRDSIHQSESISDVHAETDYESRGMPVSLELASVVISDKVRLRVHCSSTAVFPLRLTAVARTHDRATRAIVAGWDGAEVEVPIPFGTTEGRDVAVEVIGYGRFDWGVSGSVERVGPEFVDPVDRYLDELPFASSVVPKKPWYQRRSRWQRKMFVSLIDSASNQLRDLAAQISVDGSEHQRAWRITDMLRRRVVIDETNEVLPPSEILRRRKGNSSSWALCWSALAKSSGLTSGIVERVDDLEILAVAYIDETWIFASADDSDIPQRTRPLAPPSLEGALMALKPPDSELSPVPVALSWTFLDDFRAPE